LPSLLMIVRMKRAPGYLLWSLLSFVAVAAAESATSPADIEREIQTIIAAPQVTIVHLWAPWCSNCKTEMRPDGWAKFVTANPGVKVVFLNIWHKGQDGTPKLRAAGLESQPTFIGLNHPNPSNSRGEKLEQLLGMPVSWVPTTWVYRNGKLRYALNYGEVRFEMLQQMVNDAAAEW